MMSATEFVDSHFHLQDLARHYYPWLCDADRAPQLEGDLSGIRRTYLVPDYLADLSQVRLVKAVHIQNGWDPADPVGETRFLQDVADAHGIPNAIVAFADLASPRAEEVIEQHCSFPAMRGVRQILNWHNDPALRVAGSPDLMQDRRWRQGFALLGRRGLSFDLQIYWPQMDDAYALAREFPDTLIILDHFGMPVDGSPESMAHWAAALRRLAQAPNVMLKVSGLGLGRPEWTIADVAPIVERAIEIFGVDRTMFGSNLPVDRLFASADAIFEAFHVVTRFCSESERAQLFRSNAELTYRI
jgi:predicted TIM-barrel fold metal-dependent hydrolase